MAYGNQLFGASLVKKQTIMKKILALLLIVAALSGFRQSNTRHITGHVFAKDDGLPIPGVSVRIKGTNTGVQTNTKGVYAIDVPDSHDILIYSFIGYTSQEVKIKDKDVIDVCLNPSSTTLNEVVVTERMTYKSQPGQLGYATATVGNAPGTRADKSLKGKASGLQVTSAPNYIPPSSSGDESYKGIAENVFNDARSNPLSTFSVDVDAASYSNVRRFINNGEMPPANAVRIEEMINYFKYDLKGPTNGEPVAIHTELSSAPWNA